ncbi:hypothetical protein BASA82_001095 [Batrachochytrium salamandrivorans]|uniref:Vacuolar protein sorting-associated protein 27 n=1 Tax=Batrachochytrium salamandrivorans TaxID=1357716 RepID=A0ABQ8FN75_9FUNG|nr:hypothetical protein BASA61_009677 [Batrachochytrium salamandrivorans]KAH6601199.1 hypothetical protein BASA50_001724 [Batrachochytrium salamandrivorans]KAH9260880.1 hypothetical protein BASA82_001095 [Batrachochytrium salamandrivorans]KAH9268617.1 hypothetical protein BASA83_009249 [Batrachochytrium salamandrivorans]
MASLFGSLLANPFDDLVEKATSEHIPVGTDDLVLSLNIADKIKSKEVPAKTAVLSLKRRINHRNPNVQILALKLTDTCVKNSGHHFLQEVVSREFVDNLVSIARSLMVTNPEVKVKIMGLLQAWGIAFKSKPDLAYMCEVYETLKRDGAVFPPIDAADTAAAMLDTKTVPDWTDSEICMRCRTAFTTFNRKHHCRNCGQTFCNDCSSKRMPLAHLGIIEAVRVCDTCQAKLATTSLASATGVSRSNSTTSNVASGVPSSTLDKSQSDLVKKEEDDLAKAIAASLGVSSSEPVASPALTSRKSTTKQSVRFKDHDHDSDEDLKRAIEASLLDAERSTPAFSSASEPKSGLRDSSVGKSSNDRGYPSRSSHTPAVVTAIAPSTDITPTELENIQLFSELVERTEADMAIRGIGALNPAQLQALFAQVAPLQVKLHASIEESASKYKTLYDMNEKINDTVSLYDQFLQKRVAVSQQPSAIVGGSMPQRYSYNSPLPQGDVYAAPSQQQQQQQWAPPADAPPEFHPNYHASGTGSLHPAQVSNPGYAAQPQFGYQQSFQPPQSYEGHAPPAPQVPGQIYNPQSAPGHPLYPGSHTYATPQGYPQQPPPQQQQQPPSQPVVQEAPLIEL